MYSSNPNDIVCDFFLGSFSTAKVAIGLGRQACGFELNKNAFDYQIQEMEKIESGELLSELREVPENTLTNKGKPLTQEETDLIITDFTKLLQKGLPQKTACDILTKKYGRGYWSIQRMIKTNGMTIFQKQQTITLFDKVAN